MDLNWTKPRHREVLGALGVFVFCPDPFLLPGKGLDLKILIS